MQERLYVELKVAMLIDLLFPVGESTDVELNVLHRLKRGLNLRAVVHQQLVMVAAPRPLPRRRRWSQLKNLLMYLVEQKLGFPF